MYKSPTRKKVFICNMVIVLLCILSIASYFLMPFWKVSVTVTLTPEKIQEMFAEEENGNGDVEPTSIATLAESSEGNSNSSEINIADFIGDEGISISLSLQLQTKDVLSSLTADSTETVEAIIGDNVDNIVEELNEPLNNLVKNVAKNATKTILLDTIKQQVKEAFDHAIDEEGVQQYLDDAGITETYIETQIDRLINALYADNATVTSVTDTLIAVMEDVATTLKNSGIEDFADIEVTEDLKAEMREDISEGLSFFAKEDGSINADDLIAELLLQLMEETGTNDGEENEEGFAGVKALAAADGANTNAADELKTKLREMIMAEIPEDAAAGIAEAMTYVSYVILFSFFTWFYLILKIVVKLRAKNNAIKLKVPIWLGWLPFLILYLIPTIAVSMLSNPPAFLADAMGAETVAEMKSVFEMISITFSSGAWFSFAAAMFLMLFSMFYYGRQRRKLKRMKKGKIAPDWEQPVEA